jgi:hypothetical protein
VKSHTQKTFVIGQGVVALLSAALPALEIWPPPLYFVNRGLAFNYFSLFVFVIIPVVALILSARVIISNDEVESRRFFRLCNYLWAPLILNPLAFIFWMFFIIGRTGG